MSKINTKDFTSKASRKQISSGKRNLGDESTSKDQLKALQGQKKELKSQLKSIEKQETQLKKQVNKSKKKTTSKKEVSK